MTTVRHGYGLTGDAVTAKEDDLSAQVSSIGSLTRDQARWVLAAVVVAGPVAGSDDMRCFSSDLAFEIRRVDAPGTPGAGADRQLLLGCGRSVLRLRVAIRSLGIHPSVRLLPDPDQPDLLAVVRPQGRSTPAPDDLAVADALTRLRGEHRQDRPSTVPVDLIDRLRQAAKAEQSWLAVLAPDQVVALSGPERAGSDPGAVPRSRPVDTMVVVGSLRDVPVATVHAGQAAERVMLTASAAGVPAALLPEALTNPASRERTRDLMGGGLWPQCLIRLGVPRPMVDSAGTEEP